MLPARQPRRPGVRTPSRRAAELWGGTPVLRPTSTPASCGSWRTRADLEVCPTPLATRYNLAANVYSSRKAGPAFDARDVSHHSAALRLFYALLVGWDAAGMGKARWRDAE